MAASLKLSREPGFATAALTAALRRLQACEASELTAAIVAGTGGKSIEHASVWWAGVQCVVGFKWDCVASQGCLRS